MSEVPLFQRTMNPLLEVLRESPTPLRIEEIERRVAERMQLSPDLLAIPHDEKKPDRSEVGYRIAWARTWLKKAGLVDNPRRGEWTVTEKGRTAGHVSTAVVFAEVRGIYRDAAAGAGDDASGKTEGSVEAEDALDAETEIDASEDEAAAARVGPVLADQLLKLREKLAAADVLPTREQVAAMLARFRERFSPGVLAGLDGHALLTRLHARGTKESLVHWLEFKDDDELATSRFGSIAGGSALKFGLYQSVETGAWMSGSAQHLARLELDEAIALARQQRDQLVAAASAIESAGKAREIDYDLLQEQLAAVAPNVADTAWGHKTLAMWFPDRLDPFHVPEHQAHHLRKLLKLAAPGRYANAGLFVGIGRQLGMTLLELARVLVERHGGPYATWRIGTKVVEGESAWESMRAGGFIAIGWPELGDLSTVEASKQGKEVIRARLEKSYPNTSSTLSKLTNQIYSFVRGAQERDVVVAMDGARVLGVGRIVSPYEAAPAEATAHRRRVSWELTGDPWKLPHTEGLMTAFMQLKKHPLNLIEVEARLLGKTTETNVSPAVQVTPARPAGGTGVSTPPAVSPLVSPPPLHGVAARIDAVLHRKRQVILYGPPGTGKTYWATLAAREIVARAWFSREEAALTEDQRAEIDQRRAIELVSFHPAYGYEDFLEGYRPSGGGTFELKDGLFKRVCARAASDGARPYVLVVDEINRGDLPRIFGELLTVIERDKRGRSITLPLSGTSFVVPDNVYLVGTMNTADRSIALLDAALRRRFGFIELLPDATIFKGIKVDKIPLEAWLDALNEKILEHAGRDARNLRVGHAYFIQGGAPIRELARLAEILRDDVIPLLEEVCYEDFDALERILGGSIVLRAKKRIAVELFEPDRYDALQDAILQAFPGLITTKAAADADATTVDFADEDATDATETGDEGGATPT